MSFGSILLGALIAGVISTGSIIGITFLGTLVPWWAILLIAIGGLLIGGFVGGLVAKGGGSGALAGLFSGLLVFLGVFLFTWLYYKAQILALISSAPDVDTLVSNFLSLVGIQSGTEIYNTIYNWITTNAPTINDVEDFVNSKFVFFALIIGAIFGALASVVSLFAGLIGGLITRKKEESYDSYY
ncbi:MAG: hypothetical protein ACTSXO_12835 [Candidatus Heimdallarchaeota archaeon]